MKRKLLAYAGIFLILDGVLSVIFQGAWNFQFENIIRYIRAIIGAIIWWTSR